MNGGRESDPVALGANLIFFLIEGVWLNGWRARGLGPLD